MEPAARTAAGSRRTAARRTRTRAAAGTACRRPPRGLAHVSYDRIRGRLRASDGNASRRPPGTDYGALPDRCGRGKFKQTRELVRSSRSATGQSEVLKVSGNDWDAARERETERSGEARNDAQGSRECGESGGVRGALVARPACGGGLSGEAGARGAGGAGGGPTCRTWAPAPRSLSLRHPRPPRRPDTLFQTFALHNQRSLLQLFISHHPTDE